MMLPSSSLVNRLLFLSLLTAIACQLGMREIDPSPGSEKVNGPCGMSRKLLRCVDKSVKSSPELVTDLQGPEEFLWDLEKAILSLFLARRYRIALHILAHMNYPPKMVDILRYVHCQFHRYISSLLTDEDHLTLEDLRLRGNYIPRIIHTMGFLYRLIRRLQARSANKKGRIATKNIMYRFMLDFPALLVEELESVLRYISEFCFDPPEPDFQTSRAEPVREKLQASPAFDLSTDGSPRAPHLRHPAAPSYTSIKMEAGLASKRVWCKPAHPSEHCIRLNPSGYTMNPERFMESDNLTFASDIVVQIMDVQGSTVRTDLGPRRWRPTTAVNYSQGTNFVSKVVTSHNAAKSPLDFEVSLIAPGNKPDADDKSFADTFEFSFEFSEVATGADCVHIKSR
ncbi:hypothetical protein MARPO_0140s0001 [Marchantia polymorpha]|uniref:Uncharacterized protein n=1 Tax=Marchantia polymorpha TaxID=3197 RepID=A0A2R6W6K1_MARPO|nr:hypothetical protein MARPO_0140s0001 [Marchantia polymorpha]|eukprot:PTQ29463.1 hypothetical protein MARPO_0140s0001 [Marchantia polymorpha]